MNIKSLSHKPAGITLEHIYKSGIDDEWLSKSDRCQHCNSLTIYNQLSSFCKNRPGLEERFISLYSQVRAPNSFHGLLREKLNSGELEFTKDSLSFILLTGCFTEIANLVEHFNLLLPSYISFFSSNWNLKAFIHILGLLEENQATCYKLGAIQLLNFYCKQLESLYDGRAFMYDFVLKIATQPSPLTEHHQNAIIDLCDLELIDGLIERGYLRNVTLTESQEDSLLAKMIEVPAKYRYFYNANFFTNSGLPKKYLERAQNASPESPCVGADEVMKIFKYLA